MNITEALKENSRHLWFIYLWGFWTVLSLIACGNAYIDMDYLMAGFFVAWQMIGICGMIVEAYNIVENVRDPEMKALKEQILSRRELKHRGSQE